jgi:hypothetical protein
MKKTKKLILWIIIWGLIAFGGMIISQVLAKTI